MLCKAWRKVAVSHLDANTHTHTNTLTHTHIAQLVTAAASVALTHLPLWTIKGDGRG